MKFIKLTLKNGLTPIYVNPDHIIYMMNGSDGRAVLHLPSIDSHTTTTLYAWERVDEIIEMCEEERSRNEH